jgi:hypothetical protein
MEFLLQRSNMLIETEQYVKVVRSNGATYPFPSLSALKKKCFTLSRGGLGKISADQKN